MFKKIDWWWVAGGALLVFVIVLAVILNVNSQNFGELVTTDAINIDNGDAKINWDSYPTYDVELSESYNISAPGTYHLTGSTTSGGVFIHLNDNAVARLILDNVSIKNPSGPAIACYSGDDLVIESIGENYLEDGATYATNLDEDVNGAIYSKADLTLTGSGTLGIKANYQDGIVSKDDLKINGGTYKVVAADDGIRGKDSVYIVDGNVTVEAKGDGIKSTNTTNMDKGFVLIAGGNINVIKSYEGLEARKVIIDNGQVSIFSNDDGINAAEGISINDGEVYVNAAGDGIDSNGTLYFNGGTVSVDGPTNSGNGALDATGGIIMNGGTVVAVGAPGMAENLGSDSPIYNVSIFFDSTLTRDTLVEIRNSNGANVISHTSAKTFSHMAAGSPEFKKGETYNIYVDGKKYNSFTISNITTIIGNNIHARAKRNF